MAFGHPDNKLSGPPALAALAVVAAESRCMSCPATTTGVSGAGNACAAPMREAARSHGPVVAAVVVMRMGAIAAAVVAIHGDITVDAIIITGTAVCIISRAVAAVVTDVSSASRKGEGKRQRGGKENWFHSFQRFLERVLHKHSSLGCARR